MKLQFEDDLTCKEEVIETPEFEEHLLRCHTLPNGHFLAFHYEEHNTILYDENLERLNKFCWTELLGIPFYNISLTCIASNFWGSSEAGLICGFDIHS